MYKIIKDWITEPGLRAILTIQEQGNINGYVETEPGSPYEDMDYNVYSIQFDDILDWQDLGKINRQTHINNIEVHGGLTFAKRGDKNSFLRSYNYWFGFDTAHSGDSRNREAALEYFTEPEQIKSINTLHDIYGPDAFADYTYKDITYVTAECEALAKQLKES